MTESILTTVVLIALGALTGGIAGVVLAYEFEPRQHDPKLWHQVVGRQDCKTLECMRGGFTQ